MTLELFPYFGAFAEDKGAAKELRETIILPALEKGEHVVLDFSKIRFATQSLIHALIFEPLYKLKEEALDRMEFRHCAEPVRTIIEIVVGYAFNPPVTTHSPVSELS